MFGHFQRTGYRDIEVAGAKIGTIAQPSRLNQAPDGLFQRFWLQLAGLLEMLVQSSKTDADVRLGDILKNLAFQGVHSNHNPAYRDQRPSYILLKVMVTLIAPLFPTNRGTREQIHTWRESGPRY